MGGTTSKYDHITNDYELVIRVSKALDQELKENFGCSGTTTGEKIKEFKERYPIKKSTLSIMRKLVDWRNKLVHKFNIDSLYDLGTSRERFNVEFAKVQEELDEIKRKRDLSNSITVHGGGRGGFGSGGYYGGGGFSGGQTGMMTRSSGATVLNGGQTGSDDESSGLGTALVVGGGIMAGLALHQKVALYKGIYKC